MPRNGLWVVFFGALVIGRLLSGGDDEPPVPDHSTQAATNAASEMHQPTGRTPDTTSRQRHAAINPQDPSRRAAVNPSDWKPIFVTGSSVRVRTGPGTVFEQIASFKRGSKLSFTGETDGKWRRINHGKVEGWMHGDYLSFSPPAAKKVKPKKEVRQARGPSDKVLIKQIIQRSIANYSGNCPCPYNRARNNSRCGKRSAWSRPGGASPICYASDVTPRMLQRARQ